MFCFEGAIIFIVDAIFFIVDALCFHGCRLISSKTEPEKEYIL